MIGRPRNKEQREKWTLTIIPKLKRVLQEWCFKNKTKPSYWLEEQIRKEMRK